MKIRIIVVSILILALGISAFGCSFVQPPAAAAPAVTPYYTKVETEALITAAKATGYTKTELYTKAEIDKKITDSAAVTSGYTNPQIDAKFSTFISNLSDADLAVLKTKLGVTTTPTNPGTSGYTTPTGQVSYSIGNPQTYYQFSSTSNYPLQIHVFNNKSDARYVRLQLTATTFNNMAAGTFGSPAVTIATNSSSTGQTAATYTVNAVGNTVLLIATSGGVNGTGEYLLSSGQQMDLYLTLTINTSNAVLWTLTVSGSDRPIS